MGEVAHSFSIFQTKRLHLKCTNIYQVFEALGSGLVCLLWAILGDFPVAFYMPSFNKLIHGLNAKYQSLKHLNI